MNYDLAKELKEAGFPQQVGLTQLVEPDAPYQPRLEELIDACGSWFGSLEWLGIVEEWAAFKSGVQESYGGSTPTEAVARLWLALNNK